MKTSTFNFGLIIYRGTSSANTDISSNEYIQICSFLADEDIYMEDIEYIREEEFRGEKFLVVKTREFTSDYGNHFLWKAADELISRKKRTTSITGFKMTIKEEVNYLNEIILREGNNGFILLENSHSTILREAYYKLLSRYNEIIIPSYEELIICIKKLISRYERDGFTIVGKEMVE